MFCVYGEGKEWESQAEKDRRLAEMQKQWAEENAQHEAQYGPGTQGTNSGEDGGGCTQPGPEGQCNPGSGTESDSGTGQGEQVGQISQMPQQEQESSPAPESSGDSGGEVTGTGMVIMKPTSDGIITRLVKDLKNLG